jgi:hypothetical protein
VIAGLLVPPFVWYLVFWKGTSFDFSSSITILLREHKLHAQVNRFILIISQSFLWQGLEWLVYSIFHLSPFGLLEREPFVLQPLLWFCYGNYFTHKSPPYAYPNSFDDSSAQVLKWLTSLISQSFDLLERESASILHSMLRFCWGNLYSTHKSLGSPHACPNPFDDSCT